MKRDDILTIENQLNILEETAKLLKKSFYEKNLKKFKTLKQKMLNAQKKIKGLT